MFVLLAGVLKNDILGQRPSTYKYLWQHASCCVTSSNYRLFWHFISVDKRHIISRSRLNRFVAEFRLIYHITQCYQACKFLRDGTGWYKVTWLTAVLRTSAVTILHYRVLRGIQSRNWTGHIFHCHELNTFYILVLLQQKLQKKKSCVCLSVRK
jgi:hypothetical protein